jgi:peptide/nickel transport system permease protein
VISIDRTAPSLGVRRLRRKATRELRWSRATLIGGLILFAVIAGAALLSPLIAPYPPDEIDALNVLAPPSSAHLFGTDDVGRDVFSRSLYGARLDLGIIALMTGISLSIGVLLGSVAGYAGGWLDTVVGRLVDVVLAFPFLVLVIGIVAITGPGVRGIVIGMSIVGWAVYARLTRAEMLSVRERDFIDAARALGYPGRRVIGKHALPNVIRPAFVFSMSDLVLNLMTLASLSYLGLGVQPPTAELGSIIADGQAYLLTAWWISTLPGVVLVLLGVSFSVIGDALAERLGEPVYRFA